MNNSNRLSPIGLLAGLILSFALSNTYAASLSIADGPLLLTTKAKPNVMIMLDNSGSMKARMYSSNYDTTKTYDGIFDSSKFYEYLVDGTASLNFNSDAFDLTKPGAAYDVPNIDNTKKGAFIDTTCTPNGVANCWSGHFLNWLTSRRIDSSRQALVGGKVESRESFTYYTKNSVDYNYKIVANNEPEDRNLSDNYSASSSYSPIPNSNNAQIQDSANGAVVTSPATYNPYAQLTFTGSTQSYNLAVLVPNEPTGLMHDVKDDVRLGVSFYRYNRAGSPTIYDNNNSIDGGTMLFEIPKNPFINQPPANDYRSTVGYIGTDINKLVDSIEHFPLVWGTTPLAENLVEVIRYFEQANPQYGAASSPLVSGVPFVKATNTSTATKSLDPYYIASENKKLSCTKSSVLIVTDGEPYRDANVPAALQSYDGDSTDATVGSPGRTDYLDDVARWAHCSSATGTCDANSGTGLRDLRTDAELTGDQNLTIHTVAYANGSIPQILQDTADNGGGQATAADNAASLRTALTNAIVSAQNSNTSASAVTTNSNRLSTNSQVYQASYIPSTWTGNLSAFTIPTTGNIDMTSPAWQAKSNIPAYASRNVFTLNSTGIKLASSDISNLSSTQKTDLFYDSALSAGDNLTNQKEMLAYILGNDQFETRKSSTNNYGTTFRDRVDVNSSGTVTGGNVLGDIVNSSPFYVGNGSYGYETLAEGKSNATSPYQAFVSYNNATATKRKEILYVGANDGMLHAFNASTGVEEFAYIPSFVFSNLKNLADPSYTHQYFVDGPVKAGDVHFSSNDTWHTVLVGSAGAGGRGVFALDVTTPGSFDSNDVLWEATDTTLDTSGSMPYPKLYPDLGYTMTEPSIVRMANGKWAAIVANGYNSSTDTATLYIIDIETGSKIAEFKTLKGDSTTPNGLSSPVAIDIDGDKIVDTIYAGDLLGNMWKINVSDSSASNWDFAFEDSAGKPAPLFKAKDYLNAAQPITAKPLVGPHEKGGVLVYFGTGKYFETLDNVVVSATQRQSFYAVHDDSTGSTRTALATPALVNRGTNLVAQTITNEFSYTALGTTVTNDLRYISSNAVAYSSSVKGWYIDLQNPNKLSPVDSEGERVISTALLRDKKLVFVTMSPEADPCSFGGSSWFMELDPYSGGTLAFQPFDIDDDGNITNNDLVYQVDTNSDGSIDINDDGEITGGRRLPGIAGTPSVVEEDTKEHKLFGTSNANIKRVTETKESKSGRQSWRQLK